MRLAISLDHSRTVRLYLRIIACLAEIGQMPVHEPEANANGDNSKYKQMFKLRALHLMAFFILIYVGVEVTIGGKPL